MFTKNFSANMPSKSGPSRAFSDPFEHIQAADSPGGAVGASSKAAGPTEARGIAVNEVDRRTGAAYRVTEHTVNGPQGQFGIPVEQAANRFRSIMGIPDGPPVGSFSAGAPGRRFADEAFDTDRAEPERDPALDAEMIEKRFRERIAGDVRREQMMRPTTEAPEWASPEASTRSHNSGGWVDMGEYTIDPEGRIRDKPANSAGPYGGQRERPELTTGRPMLAPEADLKAAGPRAIRGPNGVMNGPAERPSDALEAKVGELRGLQTLVTNAFRGLFGVQAADHIVTRAEVDDRRTGADRPSMARTMMDSGLFKPWTPPKGSNFDKPLKPEPLVQAVGARAIHALQKGPLASDLQDLPKHERDDLTKLLGRAILNAMTLVPQQAPTGPDGRPTRDDPKRAEVRKAVALAIAPNLLQGLVPPEMLADRPVRAAVESARARTGAPAAHAMDIPDRKPIADQRERRRGFDAAEGPAAPTVGQFAAVSGASQRARRDIWGLAASDGEGPAREGPLREDSTYQPDRGARRVDASDTSRSLPEYGRSKHEGVVYGPQHDNSPFHARF